MKAVRSELNSAYRMQTKRLADLAFAAIQEDLYAHRIAWKTLCVSKAKRASILKDEVEVKMGSLGKRKFSRRVEVHSTGKKKGGVEQWRLATFQITIELPEKKPKKKPEISETFVYRALLRQHDEPPVPNA